MSQDDFRSNRSMLPPESFLFGPDEPDPPPNDLVTRSVWGHFVGLPDDVAMRTSAYQGSLMLDLDAVWSAWIDLLQPHDPAKEPIQLAMLLAVEEIDGARHAALHGHYRQAFAGLRTLVESGLIGAYGQVPEYRSVWDNWRASNEEIGCGRACDGLLSKTADHRAVKQLGTELTNGDSLFGQKPGGPDGRGGWARRVFSSLSDHVHARPGHSNHDMWKSNGPIWRPEVFGTFVVEMIESVSLLLVVFKLIDKNLELPTPIWELLTSRDYLRPTKIAVTSWQLLNDL